jgi:kinesin family protein 6/9
VIVGSGKTYTMFGGDSYDNRGLIPRTISLLFKMIKAKKDFTCTCQISFIEIYKEVAYDLLDSKKSPNKPIEEWAPISVFENEDGIFLKNLNVYEVTSEEEGINLFFMGNNSRS